MSLEFFCAVLHVKPVGKARPRVTKQGRAYTPKETVSAEAEIRWLLRKENPPRFQGPVRLEATFYLPRPKSLPKRVGLPAKKPDLDNLMKLLLDSMNGLLFEDDSQVVEAIVRKLYGEPKIVLVVAPVA